MSNSPVEVLVNGKQQRIDPGTSIAGLLDQLKLDRQQVAVEVNRELVPRQHHAECELKAGDCVEVVTLVGGG